MVAPLRNMYETIRSDRLLFMSPDYARKKMLFKNDEEQDIW